MSTNFSDFPDYDQALNISGSSIQDSQVGQPGRDLTQNRTVNNGWMNCLFKAHNTINNIFHLSFETISQKLDSFFRNTLPESIQNNSTLIEVQTQYSSDLELINQQRLNLEQSRLEYTIDSTERLIWIRQRQIQLQQEEIALKNRFFNQKMNLIKECHDENVRLKLQEIQANWDALNLPLIFSREEAVDFVYQRIGNFCILLAPPKVPSYIQQFQHLAGDIDHEISNAVEKLFTEGEIHYPIRFYNLFKREILPVEAIRIRDILSPVPTLILSSEITDREVRISVTYPSSSDSNIPHISRDNQIRLEPWDWKVIKAELEAQEITPEDSLFNIRKLIAFFHKILAVYFSDLYCLSIDPYHNPKLFALLDEVNLPDILQTCVHPYRSSLSTIQLRIQEAERRRLEEIERRRKESEIRYQEQVQASYKTTSYSSGDENWSQIVGVGIGLMLLLGFCSQIPQQSNESVTIRQNVGTIQAGGGYSGANLRNAPNGQEISILLNGTSVILGNYSDDGKWRQVTTTDGHTGWVWAELIRQPQ